MRPGAAEAAATGRALMQRELREQPLQLPAIAAALDISAAPLRPDPGPTVWAGGCGDSLYAAAALAPLYRRAGHRFRAASAAELLWDGEVRSGDTVIAISISGTTRRTVEAVAAARATGVRTLALTIDQDSPLAAAADATLLLPYAPVSRAIPHGLDYHVTLLALAALAVPLDGIDVGSLFADATGSALAEARAAAAALGPETRFVFLGGGSAAHGTAAFAAAKMHEAGGLPACSFEAETFTHGAQFMLRPGDYVGLFGSAGPADRRTRALADGLSGLGCHVAEAGFLDTDAPAAPLRAALAGALHAQAFCLAVAERYDLDVRDPARGGPAAAVQKDWFSWRA